MATLQSPSSSKGCEYPKTKKIIDFFFRDDFRGIEYVIGLRFSLTPPITRVSVFGFHRNSIRGRKRPVLLIQRTKPVVVKSRQS